DLQRDDDAGPEQRLPPEHGALAEQICETAAAAAENIKQHHRDRRAARDRVVGGAHLLITAGEGFGDFDEMRKPGEPVAADDEFEPEPAFAEVEIGPLVNEGVIDAPAGAGFLG